MTSAVDRNMTSRDWFWLWTITAFAAAVRVIGITYPPSTLLDEYWYARDGCYYWHGSVDTCGMTGLMPPDRDVTTWLATYGELTPEHPPLAKWLIGAPTAVLGYSPGAWRVASVLAGAITVGLLYLLVKRTVGSTGAAGGAALLLAIDYPHFVHSRMAMLEVFVALFAVGAFYFCLLDRAQIQARARGLPAHRRWRLAAGTAGGAAAACRLSGAFVVVGVIVLVVVWEVAATRRSGRGLTALGKEVTSTLLLLVAVPLAAYVLTYTGRLHGSLLAFPWADGAWLREWLERQSYMVHLHGDKTTTLTRPWAVPMTERPLAYLLERSAGKVREVLLFGNPLLWWAGFASVAYAAVCLVRRRRARTSALVVVGFVTSYATWLLVSLTRRDVYLFYAVPVTPFLYLALAYAYVDIARFRAGRLAATAVVLTAVLAFAFYWPILVGRPLEPADWRWRACSAQAIWLERIDRCGLNAKPPTMLAERSRGSTVVARPTARRSSAQYADRMRVSAGTVSMISRMSSRSDQFVT